MLFFQQAALLALSVASLASAHFILETPPPIGFNDDDQGLGPCGGIDIYDTTNGIRWWPNKGGPVGLITTHSESVWEFKAALRSDTSTWINLSRNITQEGVGSWCIPNIPGVPLHKWQWIGKRGVIQIIQHGHHGALYACAAVRFVLGGPRPIPSTCVNDTGITSYWGNPEHGHGEHEHKLF